mmetsp:Transcript_12785/g.19590  ORF Transcript_12785/g.19590 Transcript_12785/m.19590 type:complete len:523 (+) Transcript_12785:761-2329(+)
MRQVHAGAHDAPACAAAAGQARRQDVRLAAPPARRDRALPVRPHPGRRMGRPGGHEDGPRGPRRVPRHPGLVRDHGLPRPPAREPSGGLPGPHASDHRRGARTERGHRHPLPAGAEAAGHQRQHTSGAHERHHRRDALPAVFRDAGGSHTRGGADLSHRGVVCGGSHGGAGPVARPKKEGGDHPSGVRQEPVHRYLRAADPGTARPRGAGGGGRGPSGVLRPHLRLGHGGHRLRHGGGGGDELRRRHLHVHPHPQRRAVRGPDGGVPASGRGRDQGGGGHQRGRELGDTSRCGSRCLHGALQARGVRPAVTPADVVRGVDLGGLRHAEGGTDGEGASGDGVPALHEGGLRGPHGTLRGGRDGENVPRHRRAEPQADDAGGGPTHPGGVSRTPRHDEHRPGVLQSAQGWIYNELRGRDLSNYRTWGPRQLPRDRPAVWFSDWPRHSVRRCRRGNRSGRRPLPLQTAMDHHQPTLSRSRGIQPAVLENIRLSIEVRRGAVLGAPRAVEPAVGVPRRGQGQERIL